MAAVMHILRVGQAETVKPTAPEITSYAPFYTLLGTPHVEHVSVLFNGRRAHMFVDEDGHAKGLKRNDAATAIYRAATLAGCSAHPVPEDPEELDWIAGDAIVLEGVVIR